MSILRSLSAYPYKFIGALAFTAAVTLPILAPAAHAEIATNDRRLLVDGKPFLLNADTGWGVLNLISDEDAEYYLTTRQQQGFNAIMFDLIPGKDSTNYYGQAAFIDNDMTRPNEAYWQRIDRLFQKIAAKGLVMIAQPAVTCCGWGNASEFNQTSGRVYGEFLGKRYGKYNIIWQHCGDLDPGEKKSAIEATIAGIRKYAPKQPNTCQPNSPKSALDVMSPDAIDLNSTYTYDPDNKGVGAPQYQVYDRSLQDYNRTPTRPFFLSESKYEVNAPVQKIRRQAYWSILSGSTGHAYGNEVTCVNQPGWQDHMNDPGALDMQHVRTVFASRNWADLIPDQKHQWVVDGYGTYNSGTDSGGDNYVTAAYTPDGKLMMAYLPQGGTLTIDLGKFTSNVKASWFDPTSGQSIGAGSFNNSGRQSISAPGNNQDGDRDWVLVMEVGSGVSSTASNGSSSSGENQAKTAPQITVYEHAFFGGRSQSFSPGTYKADQGQLNIIGNDSISSLKVPSGITVNVCDNADGSGNCQTYGPGDYDWVGNELNDRISYIEAKVK